MQSVIDSIDYPPTHTYQLNPLKPAGILAERVAVIERIAPKLFKGESFLDVGANKGYFTLRAAEKCERVWAVEPDLACCKLLHGIMRKNTSLTYGTFADFCEAVQGIQADTFDRIFIGNGPHYLFREAGGWGWVHKLAELATDLVVIEGPTGMNCQDMHKCIPADLQSEFNRGAMTAAMGLYFDLEERVPSPSYTPDRYVMRYRKTKDEHWMS